MDDMEYIRRAYKVPAKRGGIILYGHPWPALRLRIRSAHYGRLYCSPFDADPKDRRRMILHPTWKITYIK